MPRIEIGLKAPDFKLKDIESKIFHLEEAVKQGPVLLVFNRTFV